MTGPESTEPRVRANEKDGRGRWARRIIMPLIIISVAGMLWFWGTQREQEQAQIIKAEIREICQRVHRTRDRDPRAIGEQLGIDALLLPELIERLREVIPDHPRWVERIDVDVHPGDIAPPYGDGTATHYVTISSIAHDRISLRIIQTGPPDETRIIGYRVR